MRDGVKYVWVLTRGSEGLIHLYIPTLGGGRIGICYSEVFLAKIDKVEHAFGVYPVWLWEKQIEMGPREWHGSLCISWASWTWPRTGSIQETR